MKTNVDTAAGRVSVWIERYTPSTGAQCWMWSLDGGPCHTGFASLVAAVRDAQGMYGPSVRITHSEAAERSP